MRGSSWNNFSLKSTFTIYFTLPQNREIFWSIIIVIGSGMPRPEVVGEGAGVGGGGCKTTCLTDSGSYVMSPWLSG